MLHIRRVDSGHTVALLDAAEVQELDSQNFVTALKVYLQPLLGTPRFRQRLYGERGEIFQGSWAQMGGPAELQVETLPCSNDFHKDLLSAVKNGDETQVIYALEQLIDPNVECLMSEHDFQRFTPLYCAALQGRVDLMKLLLEAGADVSSGGFSTPLVVAAQNGNLEVVRFLVEAGADIAKANDYGLTARRSADLAQHTAVAQYLLRVERERCFNLAAEAVECS